MNVIGRRPAGLTFPVITRAMARPPCSPGYHAKMTASESSQTSEISESSETSEASSASEVSESSATSEPSRQTETTTTATTATTETRTTTETPFTGDGYPIAIIVIVAAVVVVIGIGVGLYCYRRKKELAAKQSEEIGQISATNQQNPPQVVIYNNRERAFNQRDAKYADSAQKF